MDERPPPLPDRDKSSHEAWRNREYGSVSILRRHREAPATQAVVNVKSTVSGDDVVPSRKSAVLPRIPNDPFDNVSRVAVAVTPATRSIVAPKVKVPSGGNASPPLDDWTKGGRKPRRHTKNERKKGRATVLCVPRKVRTEPEPSSTFSEVVPYEAPLVEEPLRSDEGHVCLLTTSHYVVSGSVGPQPSAMRPFHIALDTGSGYNVIRVRDLPIGWEKYLIPDAVLPPLRNANGNRLRLLGKVALRVRFGSAMYHISFLVAKRLAVSVIIGTTFMNRHVRGIMCMDGEVWFTKTKIPILSQHQRQTPYVEVADDDVPSPPLETGGVPAVRKERDNTHCLHTVRLARAVSIPPMSQLALSVQTQASGLVFIEPKHSVLARYSVRAANGVAEVKSDQSFTIVVSNFCRTLAV